MSAGIGRQGWAADTKNGVPFRTLGHTGERVSIVGIGGYHLATPGVNAEEGIRIVRVGTRAGHQLPRQTAGITTGERANSAWVRRCATAIGKKAFLMTKIDGRDKANRSKPDQ